MTFSADLRGRTALVTGASSHGFGAHFAHVLAASGAETVVAARRREPLEDLVAEIGRRGGTARAVVMDVTDAESVRRGIAAAGPLDILVNNAGIARLSTPLEQSLEDFDATIETNLRGAWLVATEAARGMRDAGRPGSIVNIASILGTRQGDWSAAYAISKAGVLQMTRQLGLELARHDVRVNAIAPGFFITDLNRDHLLSDAGGRLVKRIPMRRFGDMGDLDGALLMLASDASAFMTGTVVTIDGGHSVMSL